MNAILLALLLPSPPLAIPPHNTKELPVQVYHLRQDGRATIALPLDPIDSLTSASHATPISFESALLATNPGAISFPIPDGTLHIAQRLAFERRSATSFTWRGATSDHQPVVFTVNEQIVSGLLSTPTDIYRLLYRQDQHWLVQLQPTSTRTCASPLPKHFHKTSPTCNDPAAFPPSSSLVTIDVLLLYTPEACRAAIEPDEPCNGPSIPSALFSLLQNEVDVSNTILQLSEIDVLLRTAGILPAPATFAQTGNARDDLAAIHTNIQIAELRDQTSADLVSVLVSEARDLADDPLCGRVFRVMGRDDVGLQFATDAFQLTVIATEAAGCVYTWTHEIGHLLGAAHDPFSENPEVVPEDLSFCFSRGHLDPYANPPFRTVMALATSCSESSPCPREPYFSNPSLTLTTPDGPPLGIPDERDNHRTLSHTAPVVAKFRPENDHFHNRLSLSGTSGSVSSNNTYATFQGAEPPHAGSPPLHSLWWEWTAPISGLATFSTDGSDFDTAIAVYQGPSLETLTEIASADEFQATEVFTFDAAGGQTFQIAVDGGVGGVFDDLQLAWQLDIGTSDLALAVIDAPDLIEVANEALYTSEITNLGPDSATTVHFFQTLGPSFEYISSLPSDACTLDQETVSCTFPSLPPGSSQHVTIRARALLPGTFVHEVNVIALETDPQPDNNTATEQTTVRFPSFCDATTQGPTISSTSTGGPWNDTSTWLQERTPTANDVVEIDGPVSFTGSLQVAGLHISSDGWLKEGAFSSALTVSGDLANFGLIQNDSLNRSLSLQVHGNAWNAGTIQERGAVRNSQKFGGCIANAGIWKGRDIALIGTSPRSILGLPLEGTVIVEDSFDLMSDAEIRGDIGTSSASALSITAPHRLIASQGIGGTFNGTGELVLRGWHTGTTRGSLSRITLIDSGRLEGSISALSITLQLAQITVGTATLSGQVTVQSGSVLESVSLVGAISSLTIQGHLLNNGLIRNQAGPNGSAQFHLLVEGNIVNDGELKNHNFGLFVRTTGNISNTGIWAPRRTELLGAGGRSIDGPSMLNGDFLVAGDIELLTNATIPGPLSVAAGYSLTINAPRLLTVGRTSSCVLSGTGTVRITSEHDGDLQGDLAELRIAGNTLVRGTIELPRIVLEASAKAVVRDTRVSGHLVISQGAILENHDSVAASYTLIVDGLLSNYGTIRDALGGSTFHLQLLATTENFASIRAQGTLLSIDSAGRVINHGTWQPWQAIVHGNITNNGTWAGTTILAGSGPRVIDGANPIGGAVAVWDDIEFLTSVSIDGPVTIAQGKTITINHPQEAFFKGLNGDGLLAGTGIARITGNQSGTLGGSLPEVRFSGSGIVSGRVTLPRIVFEGTGSQFDEATLAGAVEVLTGAVLEDRRDSAADTLRITGSLLNRGTISNGHSQSQFTIEIWGDVINEGSIEGRVLARVAGDLDNNGTWSTTRAVEAIWSAASGASEYEFDLTHSLLEWPSATVTTQTFSPITPYVYQTRFWRVRAMTGGQVGDWGSIHRINPSSLVFTMPIGPFTLREGDEQLLGWTSQSIVPTEPMLLSMKRDSVPSSKVEPDGVNWIRFSEDSPNDGSEVVTIPLEAAIADDWRFYVGHAPSGTYSGSDSTFTLLPAVADLSVSIAGLPDPIVAGSTLTYSVVVLNAGPSAAHEVVVSQVPPIGAVLVATIGCLEDPNGLPTCSLGSVPPEASALLTATYTLDPGLSGSVSGEVCVTSSTNDPTPGNDCAIEDTTLDQVTDLSLSLMAESGPVVIGHPVNLSLTARNLGPSHAFGVSLEVTLSSGLAFISAAPPGLCSETNGVITCSLGALPSGASTDLTITATALALGEQIMTASISGLESDPEPGNNTASATTTVVAFAGIFTDGFESGDLSAWSARVP